VECNKTLSTLNDVCMAALWLEKSILNARCDYKKALLLNVIEVLLRFIVKRFTSV